MKMILKYLFISSCIICLLFVVRKCASQTLKICVTYEANSMEDEIVGTTINLNTLSCQDKIVENNVRHNVQNCVQIDIALPRIDDALFGTADDDAKFALVFDIFLKPIRNDDYEPSGGHDENPSDDQPYESPFFDHKMDDIRTMVRSVKFVLFTPQFSKRYTINLGKIGPPTELFWSRNILLESKIDAPGNFHAFWYAIAYKNQRTAFLPDADQIFIGHAQLVKSHNEEAASGEEAASTSQSRQIKFSSDNFIGEGSTSQQSLIEYKLSIPINAKRLFKHKVMGVHLEIYYFYEENFDDKNLIADQNQNDEETNKCPICFEPLKKDEKLAIKLHKEHNENSKHIFHKHCIVKWVTTQGKIFCPLCNENAELILLKILRPIFNSKNPHSPMLISSNPLGQLIGIVNGHTEDNEFRRTQAKIHVKKYAKFVEEEEEILRNHLLKLDPSIFGKFDSEKLFKIGHGGLEESPHLGQIVVELEKMREKCENIFDKMIAALGLLMIEKMKKEVFLNSDRILENINLISEE